MQKQPHEDDKTVVYLSGQMTGLENNNFDAFHEAARFLRNLGYVVISPAETAGGEDQLPREWFFRFDFAVINIVDAVVVLPSWENSAGAKSEVVHAHEVGVPVFEFDEEVGVGRELMVVGIDVEYFLDGTKGYTSTMMSGDLDHRD